MSPRPPRPDPGVALPAPASLDELSASLGGSLDPGARGLLVERVTSPWSPHDERCLLPVLRPQATHFLMEARGVLLVDASLADRVGEGRRWVHPHASYALATVLEAAEPAPWVDERQLALIEPGASVHLSARVGAGCVVRRGAVVGEGCVLEPHAVIYGGVRLGRGVRVGAGAVLGRPGFGWAVGPEGAVRRMPQLGGVEVGDFCEIGPGCTVDAGTLGPTRLGRGVKLDAHVHVGHNVCVGDGSMVAAQSGFAGSSSVGRGVLIGGQVGVADHADVGDGARLAGGAGVIGDVAAGATVAGYPAVDRGRWLRAVASMLGRRPKRPLPPGINVNNIRPTQLDITRILQVLPHRHPMVMVDRVTEITAGQSIRGHKCVSYNEPWFQGHFPSRPILPGVMILEALAQIGGILAYASEPFDPSSNLMYFLGIDKAKFRKPVVPGDRLDLFCEVVHHRSNVWKLRGEASVDGTLCAQGELLASIVDRAP